MRIRASSGWRGRLATLAALPAAGVVLAACGERANTNATSDASWPTLLGESGERIGFPHQVVTSEGIAAAGLYLPILLIAFVIFILIEGLLLYMVWRFRRRSKDGELPEQVHGNNRLEIIWTAIPLVVVAVLFAGSVVVLNDVESKTEDPDVVVHAMAQQFGWTFTYQDFDPATGAYADTGIVAYGRTAPPSTSDPSPPGLEMVLPIDRSIRFRIEARDVIHSFYVPAFFFKRDAIPGRVNEFEVTIEEPGVYGGQCAEFCGLLHGQMFFTIRAVEGSEYDAWVAEQRAGPTAVTAADTAEVPPAQSADEDAEGSVDAARVLEIGSTADKPIAFDVSELQVQAGATVTVRYRNDSNVPHNIAFYDGADPTSATQLVMSETITGPDAVTEVTFTVPETPGEYLFRCELHPLQMVGMLVVSETEPAAA